MPREGVFSKADYTDASTLLGHLEDRTFGFELQGYVPKLELGTSKFEFSPLTAHR